MVQSIDIVVTITSQVGECHKSGCIRNNAAKLLTSSHKAVQYMQQPCGNLAAMLIHSGDNHAAMLTCN